MPKNKELYLNSKSFWRLSEAFFMGKIMNLLYMESMLMIQLYESEDCVADYIAMFDDLSKKTDDLIKMDDDYTLRLVNSRNDLREKVYIFDQGLDDRIIELMKLFIRIDISQKNPEHEVDKIFFEY